MVNAALTLWHASTESHKLCGEKSSTRSVKHKVHKGDKDTEG